MAAESPGALSIELPALSPGRAPAANVDGQGVTMAERTEGRSHPIADGAAVMAEVQAHLKNPVVTELEPLRSFWPAEDYHQHYFANHPGQGYCAFVVAPKVEKFRRTMAQLMRT